MGKSEVRGGNDTICSRETRKRALGDGVDVCYLHPAVLAADSGRADCRVRRRTEGGQRRQRDPRGVSAGDHLLCRDISAGGEFDWDPTDWIGGWNGRRVALGIARWAAVGGGNSWWSDGVEAVPSYRVPVSGLQKESSLQPEIDRGLT